MGLKDLFKKHKTTQEENNDPKETEPQKQEKPIDEENKEENQPTFYLGVLDTFNLIDSENLVVVGHLKGVLHVGDAVYVSNPGDDNGSTLLTEVLGIEIAKGLAAKTASNRFVSLMIGNAAKQNIKCGTVLFTKNTSSKDVHYAYISALGDEYVKNKALELSDKDLEKMSLTDCCETVSLNKWYNSKHEFKDSNAKNLNSQREAILYDEIKKKLLKSDVIYAVYNKITDEPNIFSHTVDKSEDEGYLCTSPNVRLITKAYNSTLSKMFPDDTIDIKEIKNGDDGKGIENFLGNAFYLNGACAVSINDENLLLASSFVVKEPDYSDLPEIRRPVVNPDLVRWLLLIAQMGKADTPDKETIFKVYYSFLLKELPRAKLLIPMKHEGEIPQADENGKTVLKKDVKLMFSIIDGKNDRQAVRMYTDWKRFHDGMGEGYEGMIQPIEGMIDHFDIALNLTSHTSSGCYIDKETFEHAKELTENK